MYEVESMRDCFLLIVAVLITSLATIPCLMLCVRNEW